PGCRFVVGVSGGGLVGFVGSGGVGQKWGEWCYRWWREKWRVNRNSAGLKRGREKGIVCGIYIMGPWGY
nr:hypothetical protein [Tanacetum cinerariifolium]